MEFADDRGAKSPGKAEEKKEADSKEPAATSLARFIATAALPVEALTEVQFTGALTPGDVKGVVSARVLTDEPALPNRTVSTPTPDAGTTARLDPAPFRKVIVDSLVEAVSKATGSPDASVAVNTVLKNLNPMDKTIFNAYANYLAFRSRQRPDSPIGTPQVGAQQLELLDRIRESAIKML